MMAGHVYFWFGIPQETEHYTVKNIPGSFGDKIEAGCLINY